jgi:hypothetical protein
LEQYFDAKLFKRFFGEKRAYVGEAGANVGEYHAEVREERAEIREYNQVHKFWTGAKVWEIGAKVRGE